MRILEARDGFIKFESAEKIAVSSFLHINGFSKQYIAQVIKMNCFDEKFLGYAKILFVYDGLLKNYDKTLPAHDAEIKTFDFDILNKSFDIKTPIITGKLIGEGTNIPIDKSCFDKKMLVCVDSANANNIISSNLAQQFSKKSNVLVIDMLGVLEAPKFVAGVDFKLPLNTDSLEFMFEDCLNDATSDSKSLIKEIFADLSEYSKTVPFLPFGALKSIVDDMVDKSHIFKLLVLKNKLSKFDKMGYFAATATEANNLNKILTSKSAVIDLSKLDSVFQNRYLSVIYSAISKQKINTTLLVEASNALNKKNIKTILTSADIPAVFITHSRFKYINEIKNLFENFIIEPSFTSNEVFKSYGTFLNSMAKNTYLVVGKGTNYIPLISELELMDFGANEADEVEEKIKEDIPTEDTTFDKEEILTQAEDEKSEPATVAIDKKADALIEKVSEDIKETDVPELFTNDETEEENIDDTDLNEIVEPEEKNEEETSLEEETFQEEEETTLQEDSYDTSLSDEMLSGEENVEEISEPVEDLQEEDFPQEEISLPEQAEDMTLDSLSEEILDEEPSSNELEEKTEEFHTSTDDTEIIEIPTEISDFAEEIDEQAELTDEDVVSEEPTEELQETTEDVVETPDVIPVEDDTQDLDEIVELDDDEISDDDILVDISEPDEEENQNLDEEIVKDVDKVFTTMKEESISDSDLDFIDELNNEDSELEETSNSDDMVELSEFQSDENEEDGFLEPLEEVSDSNHDENKEILEKRESSTPIVPVYNADIPQEDMVMSDSIEQGDTVVHAKYGTGIVEKMIKYGTKTLYSINFDNIGRRLLDPTLTEIKKA